MIWSDTLPKQLICFKPYICDRNGVGYRSFGSEGPKISLALTWRGQKIVAYSSTYLTYLWSKVDFLVQVSFNLWTDNGKCLPCDIFCCHWIWSGKLCEIMKIVRMTYCHETPNCHKNAAALIYVSQRRDYSKTPGQCKWQKKG